MTEVMTPVTSPTPQKPWRHRGRDWRQAAIMTSLSLLGAWLIVATTGLAGILGAYVAFAIVFPIVAFLASLPYGQKPGKTEWRQLLFVLHSVRHLSLGFQFCSLF
jgi:hypothetical protein